jgi:hypothetical protein
VPAPAPEPQVQPAAPAPDADLRAQLSAHDALLEDLRTKVAAQEAELRALRAALASQPQESSARFDIVPHEQAAASGDLNEKHLLSVPTANGFVLVDRDGQVPSVGAEVELADHPGVKYVVAKVAAQPLTGRPCAYLQPA